MASLKEIGSALNPDTLAKAWRVAAQAHNNQKFPGTDLPYLLHVAQVFTETANVIYIEEFNEPSLALVCAVLHDTVEDTEITQEFLAEQFGSAVAHGVAALSKNSQLPKSQRMPDSLVRIKLQPREVWVVKLADRIVNMQTPPAFWSSEKINSYKQEAHLIWTELGTASPYLARRLSQRIASYGTTSL
jgi:(p)ppGpp synthase/HD superfamily hydrolase